MEKAAPLGLKEISLERDDQIQIPSSAMLSDNLLFVEILDSLLTSNFRFRGRVLFVLLSTSIPGCYQVCSMCPLDFVVFSEPGSLGQGA